MQRRGSGVGVRLEDAPCSQSGAVACPARLAAVGQEVSVSP